MDTEHKLNRRQFVGAAAGTAAAAALGTWAIPKASADTATAPGERLVPPGKLGVQQFSLRDSITRRSIANSLANGLQPTMGYLGGPTFPEDPTDIGPLVPLPGGFQEVFEYLASLGYRGFEFFSFNQNVNELGRQPTVAEIRSYLDAAGLVGQGTHTASLGTMFSAALDGLSPAGETQIANALVLGFPMVGFAGDPTNSDRLDTVGNTIGWQEAARRANIVGAACAAAGLKYYWHVEQNGYRGFSTTLHPELIGMNRMEWFFANTDRELMFVEPDTFHGYAGRARFPFPDGSLFDLFGWWKANYHRIVAWHIKDGTRLASMPAPPTNPFTQTVARPGFPLTATDALYEGEGTIARGYPVDPDPAVVGFKRIFDDVGAKGSRFYMTESDNAIGPAATDAGRSLRHAKLATQYLLGLRAGPKAQPTSDVESEPVSHVEEMEVHP
ncbi:MAG TPA: twin-arginine translocation signal domain-containing protein [Gaiellaceae bacterium]|nr:twin-arginine translocation signal domain-containing protein [Gaiellaceae bacterium]